MHRNPSAPAEFPSFDYALATIKFADYVEKNVKKRSDQIDVFTEAFDSDFTLSKISPKDYPKDGELHPGFRQEHWTGVFRQRVEKFADELSIKKQANRWDLDNPNSVGLFCCISTQIVITI